MAPAMRSFLKVDKLNWKLINNCLSDTLFSNKIFFRNVRGSRSSIRRQGLNSEELKYNRILQTMKDHSKLQGYQSANLKELEKNKNSSSFLYEKGTFGYEEPKVPNLENQHELLAAKVTPYYNEPYARQLELKYKKSVKVLQQLGKHLLEMKVPIAMGSDKLPCPLDIMIPSPVTGAYRNKDEFSVNYGVDGNPKTVGFYLEKSTDNPDIVCVSPEKLVIIKESHKALAKDFENYIRESSLPALTNFNERGFWKNIIARSNSKGDVMGIVVAHPVNYTEEELNSEKLKLTEYFSNIQNDKYQLKSLYFQACPHTRCTHEQAPFKLLFGDPYIIEEVNGLKFMISPESFFQTNTRAAEVMYSSLIKICRVKSSATILDLCCGIGPISLLFSSKVKNCIGIDSSKTAVKDARMSAELNNIQNVTFQDGRCEHLLKDILEQNYFEEVIAVINPARSGISTAAINTLRQCRHLKKIIYASCKPLGAMDNFTQLCRPPGKKQELGKPFLPIWSVPVDLFPHTEHFELMIMFQRL